MRKSSKLPRDLSVLKRLRVEEGLAQAQIAKHYGVTKQAISDRFARAGIKFKDLKPRLSEGPHPLTDNIRELLTAQRLSISEVARQLGVSISRITKVANELGIKGRLRSFKRYPALNTIRVGESVVLPVGNTRYEQHGQFYMIAGILGIKLSVRKLNSENVCVTREPEEIDKAEIAELRRLYVDKGLSVTQLAERYRVSTQPIYRWLDRAGIERRERTLKFPLPDVDFVRRMMGEGLSIAEIARQLNMSKSTVKTALKQTDKSSRWRTRHTKHRFLDSLKVGESVVLP